MKTKPPLPAFTTFGEMLHYLRRSAQMTQRELAIAVGYSESMISRLEHDERPPDVATILALFAPALDVAGQPDVVAQLAKLAKQARGEDTGHDLPRQTPGKLHIYATRHRLPLRLTSFVGREADVRAMAQLLAQGRLVTLTGPGGCGKTSLALETSRRLAESGLQLATGSDAAQMMQLENIGLVELYPLDDASLLTQAVSAALGLEGNQERPPLQILLDFVADRHVLLVPDNCEHLIDDVALLVQTLLQGCPNLRILATSRERLNMAAEAVYAVAPLECPDPRQLPNLEDIAQYPAVQLYVERTHGVLPSFHLTPQNAVPVAQICTLLDGIPLALELAAAAAAIFSISEIVKRLDEGILLSSPGYRNADLRHKSINDTVAWSYNLLSLEEQQLLAQLSVFVGGWTIEALQQVCTAVPELVGILRQLVQKSLVRVEYAEAAGRHTRYQLLRAVREYADGQLAATGKAERVRQQHFAYFAQLATALGDQALGPQHREAMVSLDTEYPNIHAALAFGTGQRELVEPRGRLAAALQYFWRQRSLVAEGLDWLNRAMADADLLALPTRARVYVAMLYLGVNDHHRWFEGKEIEEQYLRVLAEADAMIVPCLEQGEEQTAALLMLTVAGFREYPGNEVRAEGYIRKAWNIFQKFGDLRGAGFAGNLLTRILIAQGDDESAQSIHRDVVGLLEQNRIMWALCDSYGLQAKILQFNRDHTAELRAAKRIAEIAEHEEFPYFLHNVYILLEGLDAVTACQMAEEFLERQRQKESSALLGLALHQLGRMQLNAGHYERAACLLDEALQLWPRLGALHENGLGAHWSLIDRGQVARFMGDLELAIACFSESIRLFSTTAYPAGGRYPLLFRGQVRLEGNDLAGALEDFRYCLRNTIGSPRGWYRFIFNCLVAIGEVARLDRNVAAAAKLFAVSVALLAQWSKREFRGQPHELAYSERILAAAPLYRQDPVFEMAWQVGERLTLDEALELALAQ